MNKTLAIRIEKQYLIAGIEPVSGKFQLLLNQKGYRFPFYFLLDKLSNSIRYHFSYQQKYEEGTKNYLGDFFTSIEQGEHYFWQSKEHPFVHLMAGMLWDLKKSYHHHINLVNEQGKVVEMDKIPTQLSFADGISETVQQKVIQLFVEADFKVIDHQKKLPELLVASVIRNQSAGEGLFVVVDALHNDLHISAVRAQNENFEIIQSEKYPYSGIIPQEFEFGQAITHAINQQENMLAGQDIQAECVRQAMRATKIIDKLKEFEADRLPTKLKINTTFATQPEKALQVIIELKQITEKTTIRQKELVLEIRKMHEQHDGAKLIAIGRVFEQAAIRSELNKLTSDYLSFGMADLKLVVQQLLVGDDGLESESEFVAPDAIPEASQFETIKQLQLADLTKGKQVRLNNNDPRPGKGKSVQVLEYLGDNKFIIISSNRSLQSGDVISSSSTTWNTGMQIEMNVERGGKFIGLFQTRMVESIEWK